jgi:hypothetical protein
MVYHTSFEPACLSCLLHSAYLEAADRRTAIKGSCSSCQTTEHSCMRMHLVHRISSASFTHAGDALSRRQLQARWPHGKQI